MKNLKTVRLVCSVNVSESFGAGSPGLFQIKVHLNGCCYVVVLFC